VAEKKSDHKLPFYAGGKLFVGISRAKRDKKVYNGQCSSLVVKAPREALEARNK
jgi:hypothetical protein